MRIACFEDYDLNLGPAEMRIQSVYLLVMVAASFSGPKVFAEVMTQEGAWDLSKTFSVTEPNTYSHIDNASVRFSLFDPALGQLLSVEYSRVSGVANSRLYARNLSQEEGSFKSHYNVVGYASRTPSSGEAIVFSGSGGSGAPDPLEDWILVGGGGIDSEGSYTQYYSGSELDQFMGVGTFDLKPRIEASLVVSKISPNIEAEYQVNYAFAYEIRYVYSSNHPGDTDGNLSVGDFELLDYIDLWAQGQVGDFELLDCIDLWAAGHYYWDADSGKFKAGYE